MLQWGVGSGTYKEIDPLDLCSDGMQKEGGGWKWVSGNQLLTGHDWGGPIVGLERLPFLRGSMFVQILFDQTVLGTNQSQLWQCVGSM